MSKTIKLNQMDFKITEEELKLVQENQGKMNQALSQVGVLEAQKYGLLGYVQEINKEVEDNKKVLEEKYGAVSINLEDGSYTEITEEVK
jgi:hypothetical protein|tara:strand:+ start:1509 stop:1775 length:267 start_codon:yes stop_codon:yes gene_type:complete